MPRLRVRNLLPTAGLAAVLIPLLAPAPAAVAEVRDGRLFDPGVSRTVPAASAPEKLARLAPLIGDWELTVELHRQDAVTTATGRARLTWMNRGHAVMERTRLADFDGEGHAMATLAFLGVDPQGVWTVGEGNSWTESISLWSGGWSSEDPDGELVLHDAVRPGGGPLLLLLRRTYRVLESDRWEMLLERSVDLGQSWSPALRREYRRHTAAADTNEDFFPVRTDVGLPAAGRPVEAAQFDFLLGEFDASHWLQTADGQERRWRSDATAVYALDGQAVLEFSSFDLDPSLPDAATSILRIYNRAMRRWESLFLPNRSHRPLYFGGVAEGDRIVLHLFDAQTGPGSVFQWIFFDVRDDSYRWKGLTSDDFGTSYRATWAIDFVRKGSSAASREAPEVTGLETLSRDGTRLFGDHYRAAAPAATTVVLFHQAGGDARGEYGEIARRLQADGYEVFAWDVRGGGDRFGQANRTVDALSRPFTGGYCDAYPDVEAALQTSFEQGSGAPLFVVGSSYSAALVVRLAAEHGSRIAGAVAFSPASSRMGECAVERWLPERTGTPLLAFRPTGEMEHPSVRQQAELFAQRGVELFVAPEAAHGASMLHSGRSAGDLEPTWARVEAFLEDPVDGATED